MDEGLVVSAAASRPEALQALQAHHYDVGVVDVRLDEQDETNKEGLALMRDIRHEHPEVAVIILTGYADIAMIQEALHPDRTGTPPAFAFLEKTQTEQLVPFVKRAALRQPIISFEHSQSSQITFSIDPGQRIHLKGRGGTAFADVTERILVLDLADLKASVRDIERDLVDRARKMKKTGRELFRALFTEHPDLLGRYLSARGGASVYQYLHLVFESTRELIDLPLEFLYGDQPAEHLAWLHPIVRQVRGIDCQREPISAQFVRSLVDSGQKVHLLSIVSNTEPDIPFLDVAGDELAGMLSAVDWLEVTHLRTEEATLSAVQDRLRGCPYHIVHYLGHGGFDPRAPGLSSLYFWEQKGGRRVLETLSAHELRWLLDGANTRLVHLSCCEGARIGGPADLLNGQFLGLADAIIQAHVPSVLAYRWPVPAASARKISAEFYRSLVRHASPELALLHARRNTDEDGDGTSWASPILIVQE